MRAPTTTAPAGGPLAGLLSRTGEDFDDLGFAGEATVSPPLRPLVIAHLARRRPLLVVTPTLKDAEALADDVCAFTGPDAVAVFPPWETLPHERLSPQPATVGTRLRVLDRLRRAGEDGGDPDGDLRVVIAPVRAVLQPMDPRLAEREPLDLAPGWGGGLDALVDQLAALGYTRSSMVTQRGEFAVRGGLVDIFPTTDDHPVRVEFWGDDVDEIRTFSAGDQRAMDTVGSVTVHAARELVLDAETTGTAARLVDAVPALADQLRMLADGIAFEGVEGLVTAIHPTPAHLPDLLPDGTGLVVVDPLQSHDRATQLVDQAAELMITDWEALAAASDAESAERGDARAAVDAAHARNERAGFADLDEVVAGFDTGGGKVWRLTPFSSADSIVSLTARPWDSFKGDVVSAAQTVKRYLSATEDRDEMTVVLTTIGHGPALRLAEVLRAEGVPVDVDDASTPIATRPDGRVHVRESTLRTGFLSEDLGICLLGEFDLFGPRRHRAGRRLKSRRAAAQTVIDLEPGDPVVHSTHGVGRYVGMVTRELRGTTTLGGGTAGTVTRDYVIVEYAGGDRLFVPSDQVDSLAKYVGGEDPKVMRMGGADWDRARGKVKAAVEEMAGELIRLYQARMHSPGVAFSPDTAWQGELEQAFPHPETPDQLEAIDAVKQDMEAPVPMDRLICGDVGFGKTEVAVRAAAKCVFDHKQCAVLVPTTLLAQQHGETFTERFSGFPVEIRVLSRFASPKEQSEILDGLAAGTVDLVIGTHRLLSADITFKDLGLLIVDEEQRFGVSHKERLKQLKTSVDVLTMSATPIPRTMEMAITGIRDLSTIETAPEERQPIVTQVGPLDENLAALAIRRELLREGQVFWLHNSVRTIHAAADRIRELVPGARVGIGHGQMSEGELEQVMLDFWHREFDVLVSTTIIESGLDIPNANTLIVERADLFGLAQLYQLRGRVGRSSARGYAYLFYPEDSVMTEEAYKRLESIATHTQLGSGMSIALKDLEIRGAGSMLGADQSGQVASVGFEAYSQLMAEAVTELTQGKPVEREPEITVDLPIDAHLPKDYIADEGLRLEAYRTVAQVRDARGVKAAREELVDRYGPLPPPAERLLSVAALKAALRRWGITEVSTTPRRTVRLAPVTLSDSAQVRLSRTDPSALYNPSAGLVELRMPPRSGEGGGELIGWLASRLKSTFAGA
ncbi:transcription-repair coupling factor [Euzebya sp.]|uniref:transcription-repair coupling factor n=1 Tax=Euzebya sp. TaxID=1971409 RepID=UPI003513BC06